MTQFLAEKFSTEVAENDIPSPPDSRRHSVWERTEDEIVEWEKWQQEKARVILPRQFVCIPVYVKVYVNTSPSMYMHTYLEMKGP